MLFGLFHKVPVDTDEDTATGTWADGAQGTPAADRSAAPADIRKTFRRTAHERDYGKRRIALPPVPA